MISNTLVVYLLMVWTVIAAKGYICDSFFFFFDYLCCDVHILVWKILPKHLLFLLYRMHCACTSSIHQLCEQSLYGLKKMESTVLWVDFALSFVCFTWHGMFISCFFVGCINLLNWCLPSWSIGLEVFHIPLLTTSHSDVSAGQRCLPSMVQCIQVSCSECQATWSWGTSAICTYRSCHSSNVIECAWPVDQFCHWESGSVCTPRNGCLPSIHGCMLTILLHSVLLFGL